MISAEELRKIPQEEPKELTELSFFDEIALAKIEKRVKKEQRIGRKGVSIGVTKRRYNVLEILRKKGYSAIYWRSKWSDGTRLIISWDK